MTHASAIREAPLQAVTTTRGKTSTSSRSRLHRRSRGGRSGPQKKDGGEPNQPPALRTSPSESAPLKAASTTAAAVPQEQQGCRVARTVGRWQRKGLAGARASDSSYCETAAVSQASAAAAPAFVAAGDVVREQQLLFPALSLPLPPPPPLPPIMLPAWCRSTSAVAYPLSEDGLTHELVDFFHHTRLTAQETAARTRLLRCVEASVDALWNTPGKEEKMAQISLYGSYALGLSLPSSDIDLVLTFPAEEKEEAEEKRQRACASGAEGEEDTSTAAVEAATRRQKLLLERLHDLAEHLRGQSSSSSVAGLPLKVEVYDQCRIPRIHLHDLSPGGVACDINSSLSSDRVAVIVSRQRRWLRDAPLAAFLVRVTKAAVKQWGLNEVFAGGLASTALYCLVLRFLAQAEQLHRHSRVEEENLSPPRYDEATQSVSPLAASVCASPPSPSSPTKTMVQASFTGDLGTAAAASAVASIPSYVPSWLLKGRKDAAAGASSSIFKPLCAAAEEATPTPSSSSSVEECGASETSGKPSSQGPWLESGSGSGSSSAGNDEREGEEEDDSAGTSFTHTASVATAATACSVREAAACVPAQPRAALHDDFVTAEELTRLSLARYGASPARLLLKLWRALSADAFLAGYQVADVFGDDAVWATCELVGFSGRPSAQPGVATLELATYACRSGSDLSAASFRLPDLLALFRCSGTSLDNMVRYQRYPRRVAPTMLSTVFVDPRGHAQGY